MSSGITVIFKDHAVLRMLERSISKQEVKQVLEFGEVIEAYDNDHPYPSCLMLGVVENRPLHVVVARDVESARRIVVTVYVPDEATFTNDFKTRK